MDDRRWERCKELLSIFRELYRTEIVGIGSDYIQLSPDYFKMLVTSNKLIIQKTEITDSNIHLHSELDGIKILTLI